MKKFLVLVMALLLVIGCMTIANAETCSGESDHLFDGQYEDRNAKASTCTEEGSIEKYCSRCKNWITVKQAKAAHTPADGASETWVFADGTLAETTKCGDTIYLKVSACKVCKAPYNKETKTIEHTFDKETKNADGTLKYVTITKATCTTPEIWTLKCTRVGCEGTKNEEVSPKLGHTWQIIDTEGDTGVVGQAPTCATSGKAGKYAMCTACPAVYDGTVLWLDANGKEVKAETKGATKYDIDGVVIPQLSHDVDTLWGQSFVNAFFTYDEDGEFVWPGSAVDTSIIGERVVNPFEMPLTYEDESGNTWEFTAKSCKVTVDWQAPSCTEGGYLTVKCACGKFELTEKLDASAHDYDVVTIKYADNEGNTRTLKTKLTKLVEEIKDIGITIYDGKGNEITAANTVATPKMIEKVVEAIESQLSIDDLFEIVFALDQENQYPQLDCTVQPVIIFQCDYEGCAEYVTCLAAANKAHDFGVTKNEIDYDDLMTLIKNGSISEWPTVDRDWDHYVVSSGKPAIKEYTQKLAGHTQEYTYNDIYDAAACTDFVAEIYCAHCSVTKTVTVKGYGHGDDWSWYHYTNETYNDKPGKSFVMNPSTCTDAGLEYKECDYCTYSVVEPIGFAAHEIDPTKTTVKSATCTANGTRSFVCKNCSYGKNGEWTEVIPSYGHDYDWVVTTKPACKKAGEEKLICSRCDDVKETRALPEGHVVADLDKLALDNVADYEYEETTGGYLISKVIWKDCTKAGSVQFTCVNCYLVTIKNEPAAAHKVIADGQPTVKKYAYVDEDTCSLVTEQAQKCAYCTTKIDAKVDTQLTTHNPDGSKVVTTAEAKTCTTAGIVWEHCANCDKWYQEEDPIDLHDYAPKFDTEKNAWTFECTKCGNVKEYVADAETYTIDMSKATMGKRPTGTGKVTLENDLGDYSYMLGERYAYIYMCFTKATGEQVVLTKVAEIADDGTFSVKGSSVNGPFELSYYLVVIVDDANADELDLSEVESYGDLYVAL